MAVQSINLSTTACTAATFNGSTVEKINLNGAEVWLKDMGPPPVGAGTLKFVYSSTTSCQNQYGGGNPPASPYQLGHPTYGTLVNSIFQINDAREMGIAWSFPTGLNVATRGTSGVSVVSKYKSFDPCPYINCCDGYGNSFPQGGTASGYVTQRIRLDSNDRIVPFTAELKWTANSVNLYTNTITGIIYYRPGVACGPDPSNPSRDICKINSTYGNSGGVNTNLSYNSGSFPAALTTSSTNQNYQLTWDPVTKTLGGIGTSVIDGENFTM